MGVLISDRIELSVGSDQLAHVDGAIQKVYIASIDRQHELCVCGRYEGDIRRGSVNVPFTAFQFSDKELADMWNELRNVPVDDDGNIEEAYYMWKPETDREDIWHWFDERHSKGVVDGLMFRRHNVFHKM